MAFIITAPTGGMNGAALRGIGDAYAQNGDPYGGLSRGLGYGLQAIAGGLGRRRDEQRKVQMEEDERQRRVARNRQFFDFAVSKHPELADDEVLRYEVESGGDVGKALQWREEQRNKVEQAKALDAYRMGGLDARLRGQDLNYDLGLQRLGTTERGQDITRDLGERRIKATERGQDINQGLGARRLDQGEAQFEERMKSDSRRLEETIRHNQAMEGRQTGKPPDLQRAELEQRYAEEDVKQARKEYTGFMRRMEDKYGGDTSAMDPDERAEEAALRGVLRYAHRQQDEARQKRAGLIGAGQPTAAAPPPPPPPQTAASTGGPVQVRDDRDYAALPSGTEFIGPDGKRRRKP